MNINGVSLACWNARGIMSGALYVDHIIGKYNIDILAISEHWLFPHSLNFLGSINVNYEYAGVCDADLCHGHGRSYPRGKGGVALLWHKRLSHCIHNIDIDDDRIVGIDITLKHKVHIVCFSVYLPSTNCSNELYLEYIGKLSDLYAQHSSYAFVVFLVDFNSPVSGSQRDSNRNSRGRALTNLLEQINMCSMNMSDIRQGPSYSFSPYKTSERQTMIDHIVVPIVFTDLFSKCVILDEHELNTSDHLAIVARLNVEPICFKRPDHVHRKYSWNKYSPTEIAQTYGITLTSLLDNKTIRDCSIMCADDIDNYYKSIVEALQLASFRTIPLCRFKKHVKPKWSSEEGDPTLPSRVTPAMPIGVAKIILSTLQ